MVEPVVIVYQSLGVLAFVVSTYRWIRERGLERFDVALMFLTLAAGTLVDWVGSLVGGLPGGIRLAGVLALMAHPYTLLRVARHWQPIPRTVRALTGLGFLGTAAVFVLYGADAPLWAFVAVGVYWALAATVAGAFLVTGVRDTAGVLRQRFQWAAGGIGAFAASALLLAALGVFGLPQGPTLVAYRLVVLVGMVAYVVAFAPPPPLLRYWNLEELGRFSRALEARSSQEETGRRAVEALLDASEGLTGTGFACVVYRSTSGDELSLVTEDGQRVLDEDADAVERLLPGDQARMRRNLDPGELPGFLELPDAPTVALLSVPIATGRTSWGGLFVALPRAPLFATQAMTVLERLARQTALTLENEALTRASHAREVEDLEEETQALRYARKLQDEFVASVSHDLRGPLTAILGEAELRLSDPDLRPDARESLEAIQASGQHMLRLVDDLLDLARAKVGHLDFEDEPVDVRAIVDRSVELIRTQARAKDLVVTVDVAQAVPETVLADPGRVQQVLVNLLTNAVKFTDEGTVQVRVDAEGSAPTVLGFEVEDTGPGIPEAEQVNLFEPFTRLEGSRGTEGTGLGLAIVRRLVEAMGGEVGVESTPGEGSTFRFTLPTEAPDTEQEAALEAEPLAGMRVLGVDDQPTARKLLGRYLEALGAEAVIVEDGESALEAFEAEPFDAVLLDVQLPGVDGYEVARRLRDAHGDRVRLVALTGEAGSEARERAREAGMDGQLVKPAGVAALAEALAPDA